MKRGEAAVLLEEQKKEQEEKIKQLEASKAQVEQALLAQQKVISSATIHTLCICLSRY